MPIPRSRTLHGVLIDDRLSLSIIADGADGQRIASRAGQEWDAAISAYACSCGRPVEAKAQLRARRGRVWGARLDCRHGKLGGAAGAASSVGGLIIATGAVWLQFAAFAGTVVGHLRLPSHFSQSCVLRSFKCVSLRAQRGLANSGPTITRRRTFRDRMSGLAWALV